MRVGAWPSPGGSLTTSLLTRWPGPSGAPRRVDHPKKPESNAPHGRLQSINAVGNRGI